MVRKRVGGRRRRQLAHLVVLVVERQRDERLEAPGLVLQRTHLQQVIDALGRRLDVPVEHRDVGAHAHLVRGAVHRQVAITVALVVGDLPADARGEDLGAAAGQRIEPRRAQLLEHLAIGLAVVIGEERDLDGGEALQVDAGTDALQPAQQVRVVARTAASDAAR